MGFGEFGWQSLREAAESLELSPGEVATRACAHYLDQMQANPERQALRLPRRDQGAQPYSLEVSLNPGVAESIREAGTEHGEGLEALIHHAVFVFISDLTAGSAESSNGGTELEAGEADGP